MAAMTTHPDDHDEIELFAFYEEAMPDALADGWQVYPDAAPRAAGSGYLIPVWRPVSDDR